MLDTGKEMSHNQAFDMNNLKQTLPQVPSMVEWWVDHYTRVTLLPNGQYHYDYFYQEMWEF